MASGTHCPSGTQLALARHGLALYAFEIRIAEAVGISEMLLGCRLAIDENGPGILRRQQPRPARLIHDPL